MLECIYAIRNLSGQKGWASKTQEKEAVQGKILEIFIWIPLKLYCEWKI